MADEEDYSQFDVVIGNKEYRMIAGRVQECRDEHEKADKPYEIDTELLEVDGHVGKVILKATVTTMRGKATGHAAAYGKTNIDKTAPFENAETSAVGRALGFLGYGLITGIASAEEVKQAKEREPSTTSNKASTKQVGFIHKLIKDLSLLPEEVDALKDTYGVVHASELTVSQASKVIDNLQGQVNELAEVKK
jgi:hypothetical protein